MLAPQVRRVIHYKSCHDASSLTSFSPLQECSLSFGITRFLPRPCIKLARLTVTLLCLRNVNICSACQKHTVPQLKLVNVRKRQTLNLLTCSKYSGRTAEIAAKT